MTRINVFKISKGYSKGVIIFGSIFVVTGIFFIIRAILIGFDTQLPGDWIFFWNILFGVPYIVMGALNISGKKYYIEWDENELRFFLPDTKKKGIIKFTDIVSVNIKLFEIHLNLKDNIKVIDLNNLQFEDLKRVKEKFESLMADKNN